MNECQIPKFKIIKRAVRDRYKILSDEYKNKMREEVKASGIEVKPQSELEQLLQSLIDEGEETMHGECARGGNGKKEED